VKVLYLQKGERGGFPSSDTRALLKVAGVPLSFKWGNGREGRKMGRLAGTDREKGKKGSTWGVRDNPTTKTEENHPYRPELLLEGREGGGIY